MPETNLIRTPDQRVRVFVSSTLEELAAERQAIRDAVTGLRLVPVMFELGARPHPPRTVYEAYLAQSEVLSSLVRSETRGGEQRFSLLETIRHYALERLADGDWVQAHDRHAAYFQALAEPTGAELAGPGQRSWVGRLEAEHDNLLAAMSWLVDQGRLGQAANLFLASWRFWSLRGHLAEFVSLGGEMADSENLPPYQHALALTEAGIILIDNGDLPRGETLLGRSLPLYRQASGQPGMIIKTTVLAVLGRLAAVRGDYATASERLDEGQALLRGVREDEVAGIDRLQHLLNMALLDTVLGQVRLSQADNETAARLFANSLAVARRAHDAIPILVSLYGLALRTQAQGDLAGAAGQLKEGLAIAAEIGDETSAAYFLEALADVAGQQDNPERAARLLAAARSQLEASGSGWLHAYVPRVPHDDAVLAALRARIGDAALAWGESAGTRQARQYALE